jgi:hypothetical protein
LPVVRQWTDRAVAVSIVAASAMGTARAAGADPPPTPTAPAPVVVDVDHRDRSTLPHLPPATARTGLVAEPSPTNGAPSQTTPAPPSTTVPSSAGAVPRGLPPFPVAPAPSAPPPVPDATHTVMAGEHLWSIAAATLAARTGRLVEALAPADIAPFWVRLVERNRARVRSGNPSLVYPGEVLEVPPL